MLVSMTFRVLCISARFWLLRYYWSKFGYCDCENGNINSFPYPPSCGVSLSFCTFEVAISLSSWLHFFWLKIRKSPLPPWYNLPFVPDGLQNFPYLSFPAFSLMKLSLSLPSEGSVTFWYVVWCLPSVLQPVCLQISLLGLNYSRPHLCKTPF